MFLNTNIFPLRSSIDFNKLRFSCTFLNTSLLQNHIFSQKIIGDSCINFRTCVRAISQMQVSDQNTLGLIILCRTTIGTTVIHIFIFSRWWDQYSSSRSSNSSHSSNLYKYGKVVARMYNRYSSKEDSMDIQIRREQNIVWALLLTVGLRDNGWNTSGF